MRSLVLACAAALAIALCPIFSHALWTPDEPVGAAVGLNIVRTGDWVMPQFGGEPFLEKPPLYWWVQAAGFHAFGVSDGVARLPSALFMFLTLLLVYGVGRRLGGLRTGWVALAGLASFVQFNEDMGRAVVDPALVFFVAVAWVAIAVWDVPTTGARDRRLAALAVGLGTALAFLSKGWVGCGLALGAPAIFLLLRDRGRALGPLLRLAPWVAGGLLALGLPWVLALAHDGGMAAVRECLLGNTLGRFFGTAAIQSYGHRQPFWYYPVQALVVCLPWVLALPAAWQAAARHDLDTASPAMAGPSPGPRVYRLFLGSAAVGVALLSLAASKRTLYLVPLLPGVAVAVAGWLTAARPWLDGDQRLHRVTARALLAFAAVAPLLLAVGAAILGFLPISSPAYAPLLVVVRRAAVPLVLTLVSLAAAVFGVGCTLRVARAWRLGTPRLPAGLLVLPPLLLLLFAQSALKWALDPIKTLHDTTAALAAASPGRGTLALFLPETREEKIAAIVDYDLGRKLQSVKDEAAAERYFAAVPDGAMLIASGRVDRLEPGFRKATRVVYDEQGRKASPYAILVAATRPAASR